MATVTKKYLPQEQQFGGTPYGNGTTLQFNLTTTAAGAVSNGDSTSAVGIGDVVRMGILPAGARLHDALAIVSDAFTAATTAKIGFAYVDGVDSTSVPQDDDYFFVAGLATNALGRTRSTNTGVAPITLPKDAYVILTNAGAAHASVGILDLLVECVLVGAP